jgi:hypothetical protein
MPAGQFDPDDSLDVDFDRIDFAMDRLVGGQKSPRS